MRVLENPKLVNEQLVPMTLSKINWLLLAKLVIEIEFALLNCAHVIEKTSAALFVPWRVIAPDENDTVPVFALAQNVLDKLIRYAVVCEKNDGKFELILTPHPLANEAEMWLFAALETSALPW